MGEAGGIHTIALGPEDVPEIVSVLCESFFDYPVMRFVLGSDGHYDTHLERLVSYFVMARVLRGERLLGVHGTAGLRAAALVSRPDGPPGSPELEVLREETWASLGPGARSRYEAFGEATRAFTVAADHIHLNMIGVRRAAQGQGLARALLEAVHAMSEEDPSSGGVSLTTEVDSNVTLYERFGYEVIGSARVASELATWGMYRPDRPR